MKRPRRFGKVLLKYTFFIALIGIIIGVGWWHYYQEQQVASHLEASSAAEKKTAKKQPVATKVESTMLYTGNIFWGRYMNDWSQASKLKYAYPFSGLHTLHRDSYDAWIAGMECPVDPDVHMTSAEMEENLEFNCRPEYLPEAAKWFDVLMLANNHSDNQGVEGFQQTKEQIEKAGMQYFGHYDPRVTEDTCEVIAMPVTVEYDNGVTKKEHLPIALCAYHGVFRIPPQPSVDEITEYSKYMPVIAMTHMGAEYEAQPDQIRTTLYRSLIDAGADMVLGDHPHWVQSSEAYKGKLIVYSMGNFMFDQQFNREVTRSAAIKVKLTTTAKIESNQLHTWLSLGDSCKKFKDDCLHRAKEGKFKKLSVKYDFDVVGTDDSNKLTKRASPDLQASIEQRLNWQQTKQQLQ